MYDNQDYYLAAGEVAVYGILVFPLFVILRTTRFREPGWLFLTVFVILQLIGSIITLSNGLGNIPEISSMIITNVGISPLVVSIIGVLSNAVSGTPLEIDRRSKFLANAIFHIAVIAGTTVYVVGFANQLDKNITSSGWGVTEAGITILIIDWLVSLLPIFVCLVKINKIHEKKALVLACCFASICLGVRIIYTATAVYSDPFELFVTSLAVKLCWSVLEGMLIVLVLVLAGLYCRKALVNKRTGPAFEYSAPMGRDMETGSPIQYYEGK